MSKLVLDIQQESDLEVLLPLLRRLKIRFFKSSYPISEVAEIMQPYFPINHSTTENKKDFLTRLQTDWLKLKVNHDQWLEETKHIIWSSKDLKELEDVRTSINHWKPNEW